MRLIFFKGRDVEITDLSETKVRSELGNVINGGYDNPIIGSIQDIKQHLLQERFFVNGGHISKRPGFEYVVLLPSPATRNPQPQPQPILGAHGVPCLSTSLKPTFRPPFPSAVSVLF